MPVYYTLLIAMGLLLVSQMTAAGQAEGKEPNHLATLRPGHPRLIVLDEQIQHTRQRLKTESVLQQYLQRIERDAGRFAQQPPVEHKLIGPRLLSQSRTCLDRIYTYATLYRISGDRQWVDRALVELEAAAGFPDWNPSHFLDTAEMTHAFAIGYDWLYPALTDAQRAMIRTAIIEKGLKPGLDAYNGARYGWWRNADHNWNQVCNGGLVLGALAIADEEPQLAGQIIHHALLSLPRAMRSFAPDGGWEEGPGYWDYTLRYTLPLIMGLESALGEDFGLSAFEGFAQTASYRLHVVGPLGKTFNYADVGSDRAGDTWMMHELARRFDRPAYHTAGGLKPWTLGLFVHQTPPQTPAGAEPLDRLFRGIDVVFMRSAWGDANATWLGFKGGDNQANHAHLDLGCFVFDALGQRWAIDLGADDYNLPGYFGKERWSYYRLATAGQNTLLLNNQSQATKAKAPIIAFSTGDTPRAVADLTAAYPDHATRIWRGASLVHQRRGLLIQDEIEANELVDYLWQMHTPATVRIESPTTATLELADQRLHARLISTVGGTFALRDATSPPPQASNKGIRKLVVTLPKAVRQARVAVILSPVDEPVEIIPLQQWVDAARTQAEQ